MRRAAKVDRNHGEVVKALRAAGCTVQPLHAVGEGCPDVLVGIRGRNLLMEIKDGELPPSKRRLTPEQLEWHAGWKGDVAIVTNVREALELVFGQ